MKNSFLILFLLFLFLPLNLPAIGAQTHNETNILAYSNDAYRLKRKLMRLDRDIYKNERQIRRIKASKDLSYNEKKRQIRKLEREIYYDKKELRRIRLQYRRALS